MSLSAKIEANTVPDAEGPYATVMTLLAASSSMVEAMFPELTGKFELDASITFGIDTDGDFSQSATMKVDVKGHPGADEAQILLARIAVNQEIAKNIERIDQ